MQPTDQPSAPGSDAPSTDPGAATTPGDSASVTSNAPAGLAAGVLVLLVASAVAGYAASQVVPMVLRPPVAVDAGMVQVMSNSDVGKGTEKSSAKESAEDDEQASQAPLRYAAVVFGIVGLLVAGLLGFVEGIAKKSIGLAILGLLAGLVLGAGLGAAGGAAAQMSSAWLSSVNAPAPNTNMANVMQMEMANTMVMHGVGWGLLAVAVGLAVGLPSLRVGVIARSIGGAILGGALASLLFSPALALFASGHDMDFIPEDSMIFMCWIVSAAVLIGTVTAIVGQPKRTAKPS